MAKSKKMKGGRAFGFYLGLLTAFFSVVTGVVFMLGYGESEYMSMEAFTLVIAAAVAFVVLSLFRGTSSLAPVALFGLDFCSFLLYIHAIYMYLSSVFYGGFSVEALDMLDSEFVRCTLLWFVIVVLSNICMFMRQRKPAAVAEEKTKGNQKATKKIQKAQVVRKRSNAGFIKALTNISAIVFGVIMLGGTILYECGPAVTAALGCETQRTEYDEEAEKKLEENPLAFEYYDSAFNSVAEVKRNGEEVIEKVVGEGSVLLKNENDALPLQEGERSVSLFSMSSVDLVYAGTGSSGTNTSASVDMRTAFNRAGIQLNETLWNWYKNNYSKYGRGAAGGSVGASFSIKDASWDNITTEAKTDSNYGDAAIFVLARLGGEGKDLTISGGSSSDMTNGNYLELSPNEKTVLTALKEEKDRGTFKKIIVIMNSANPVQCDFIDDPAYDIDAMLWCGDLGATGAYAVADILTGKVNPSGKLADTFWMKHRYNPVYANWGSYSYPTTVLPSGYSRSGNSNTYVVYQEGIYNGYRYTETRYEDYVMNTGEAGAFDYEEVVSYPFGYGLSYTQFEYSDFEVKRNAKEDVFEVSVTVKNIGDVAGKEAVEIYLQKPYTEYDIAYKVEKASVELVGYGKTAILQPGKSEEITIKVDGSMLASYDAYGARTYIVDDGDYYFATGNNAHEAINNILDAKGFSVSDGMTENGNEELTFVYTVSKFDETTYAVSSKAMESGIQEGKTEITNQFDDTDLNLYAGKGDNSVTYITRNNWESSVKFGFDENYKTLNNNVKITVTDQMKQDILPPTVEEDDVDYPEYASEATAWSLIDLRAYSDGDDDVTNDKPIEYNNPMWDELLNEMTKEQCVELLLDGFRRTVAVGAPINKPATIDHNGATGPVQPYGDNAKNNNGLAVRLDDPDKSEKPSLYPSNGLCAATYNDELMEEYGRAWGEDCLWAGYSGIYGPGLNIHRGAYCGRAFEYYSEDGVLTGLISGAMTRGLAEKGVYVYLKHCFLNEQEKNREGICTWANEQSIREIYLRGFKLAIEKGGADCVMTGFNRLGLKWTGHQGFCNTVLRAEFGMTGFAVSDYYDGYMTLAPAILAGNDLPDGPTPNRDTAGELDQFLDESKNYGELAWAIRESAHRILYTVVQSNAMNGKPAGTKIIPVTPYWQPMVDNAQMISGVIFGLCSLILIIKLLKNCKKEK